MRLTFKQQKVLDFIAAGIADQGYAPTMREIADHIGVTSTNAVNDHLVALERKGALVRTALKSRTLRPVATRASQGRDAVRQVESITAWLRETGQTSLAAAADDLLARLLKAYPPPLPNA